MRCSVGELYIWHALHRHRITKWLILLGFVEVARKVLIHWHHQLTLTGKPCVTNWTRSMFTAVLYALQRRSMLYGILPWT